MAAWALVTPAAHIPVGGILDTLGEVATVVGSRSETIFTADSTLRSFRLALATAARQSSSQAIGLAYMVHTVPPRGRASVDAVVVEVEHRNGYRANVVFPYTRNEAQEPVFGESFMLPGTLRSLPAPSARLEQSARRIVEVVPFPTFITNDAAGRPQARTVQPQQPDSAWTVWFATNPRTRKVTEIGRDPRVALHYFDPKTLSYVTLIGRARVVRDRVTKDAHWDAAWTAFYPDRDTSVVLIAVTAERLEIVSSTLGISGDAATWRPPTVRLPRR